MIPEVGTPLPVSFHQGLNLLELEEAGMGSGGAGQSVFEQRPQWSAKPLMRGNIETNLLMRQGAGRELAAHQLP